MHRRTFLAAFGTASLSGCLSAWTSDEEPPVGQVDCQPTVEEDSAGIASEPTSVDGQWSSFQYDDRNTGFNPDASGPRSCPGMLWRYRFNRVRGNIQDARYYYSLTGPIVHDGTLYACDNDNTLYALDAVTGTERWTLDLRGSYIYGPMYADGSLYLTSHRHLVAIDNWSRSERWAIEEPAEQGTIEVTEQSWIGGGTPAASDGRVFVGTGHGLFCAFDAGSGERLWHQAIEKRYPTWDGEGQSPPHEPLHGFQGQPAIHDGVVYVANNNGRLYAFDVESGEELWYHQPGDRLDYAPTVHDGTVYVTGSQGIYAVSVDDGVREWAYGRAADLITRGSPAIAGDTLVAVAGEWQGERKLVALDARTGELRWQTQPLNTSWGSSACIAGKTIVMGMRWGLLAVELPTGKPRWSAVSEEVSNEPVLVDDMVIASDSDGYVYALR